MKEGLVSKFNTIIGPLPEKSWNIPMVWMFIDINGFLLITKFTN